MFYHEYFLVNMGINSHDLALTVCDSVQKRNTEASGGVHGFHRVMHMKFLPDRIKMVVDSVLAHMKLRRNFLVKQSSRLEFKDLHLSQRQGTKCMVYRKRTCARRAGMRRCLG